MMRRISMAARDELVAAIARRYAQGDRAERGRILDEFAAVTGFHRKHAMRLLRAGRVTRRYGPGPDRELQLFETNKQLRALAQDELDRPETRRKIENQAIAEQSNGRRLSGLVNS